MNKINIAVFTPGKSICRGAQMLDEWLVGENPEQNYSRMMRWRLSGKIADECHDTFFIAYDDNRCLSRLWHGWGNHREAVGNFGNFRTRDNFRGKGIGNQILAAWFHEVTTCRNPPAGLFCSAGNTPEHKYLVELYGRYGFRPAVHGTSGGALYCPLNGSPDSFQEFCECYYTPSQRLTIQPASVEWRHEIDCLLMFALRDLNQLFGLPGVSNLEDALLNPAKGKAEVIFTDNGHCVGWTFAPTGGTKCIQLHPVYKVSALKQ